VSFLSGSQLFTMSPAAGSKPRAVTTADRFADGIDFYDWLPDGSGFVVSAADPVGEGSAHSSLGDVIRQPGPTGVSSISRVFRSDGRIERLLTSPFDELEALSVSPDGNMLAVIGCSASETIASNEVALVPLTGAGTGAPRQSRNLVLEDRIFWAGRELY